MKKRYIVYAILLAGLGYLIYHRIASNKKNDTGKGSVGGAGTKNAVSVDGIVAKPTSFTGKLEIAGTLEANEAITLRSEVTGLVTAINFTEGSYVSKGSLLVKINDRDIQAQLREAQTKQNLSSTTENRAKQLLAKGAISQEEYDTALADLQTLKAQGQLIRAQLAKTVITAPFSGRVGLRQIAVGEYITPSTVIASLTSINPIKLTFSIPERYSAQIKTGSSFSFRIDGNNKTFSAKIYAAETSIDPQTRTLKLRALAPNPNGELLPGNFAKVSLPLSTIENAILIPTEAIIPVLEGKSVYVKKGGKAKQVTVETANRTDSAILVTKGISAGDTVLTTGSLSIRDGAKVKVKIAKKP